MANLVQDWVTAGAQRHPGAVAVVGEGDALTYGELETLSTRLARALHEAGLCRGDRVCLLMPKTPLAIACLLGIYKAGGIYVPLDPGSPAPRLRLIADSCTPRFALAAGPVHHLLAELLGAAGHQIALGWLDRAPLEVDASLVPAFTLADVYRTPKRAPRCATQSHDPAHILYTSGTTGVPKGVVITHANVIAFIDWALRTFHLNAGDRLSGHSPLHFDLSFFDIFGALAAGAQLHLVPHFANLLPHRLAAFIRGAELTQWFSAPSALHLMAKLDVVRTGDFPTLRRLLWCGEVFPTASLISFMQRLPHVQFTNLYGPTETTIASSYYTLPTCPSDATAPIPIGVACDGEELLVLDANLQPVPPETSGDLYVRGTGVSIGYWQDETKTRQAFLKNPRGRDPSDRIYKTGDLAKISADGLVYFLGRADTQIKSRGHRIELGEIEAALNASETLAEAAVVAVESDGLEGAAICCAYVPAPGAAATPVTLRSHLAERLPAYMLPVRWQAYARLPHNANDKIDRERLKQDFRRRVAQTH